MANIKSAKKRILTNRKKQEQNKMVKSRLKTTVKTAKYLAANQKPEAVEAAKLAQKRVDSAATRGVIHPNKAARLKSQIAKANNKQ